MVEGGRVISVGRLQFRVGWPARFLFVWLFREYVPHLGKVVSIPGRIVLGVCDGPRDQTRTPIRCQTYAPDHGCDAHPSEAD